MRATTSCQEAVRLEKALIRTALQGNLPSQSHSIKLFAAVDDYLKAKKATASSQRAIEFDRERLEVVKRVLGDVKLSAITPRTIEGVQAKPRVEGASNRAGKMDIGALRQVMKRFKQVATPRGRREDADGSRGEPVGRVLTSEEQERRFETAEANPEWEHVYCAAILAANTSMRGVEVKNERRKRFQSRLLHPVALTLHSSSGVRLDTRQPVQDSSHSEALGLSGVTMKKTTPRPSHWRSGGRGK